MADHDRLEHTFIAVLARNEILQRHSTAFQEFFTAVGSYRWGTDFEARRPQGPIGDRKCDGYQVSTATVFQCYAPRKMEARGLLEKIKSDFDGAVANRDRTPLRRWVLVHNDHDGLPTEAHELVIQLRTKHAGDIEVETWDPNFLLTEIMKIPVQSLRLLFPNGLAGTDLGRITYQEIDALIASLGPLATTDIAASLEAPSSRKLEHNRFSDSIVALLRSGLVSQPKYASYFRETSRAEVGNLLADRFKLIYRDARDAVSDPDQIFYKIVESVGGLSCDKARRAAIVGLVSYLFHTCEIFENPALEAGS